MKKIFLNSKLQGFTLSELLVVLVIVGILTLLALPVLMPLITSAKSTEAKIALEHLHGLQKVHFMERSRYSDNLTAIGFEQEALVSEDGTGTANYRIEIVEVGQNSFLARATAVVDFDGDGQFNVWEINQDKALTEVVTD